MKRAATHAADFLFLSQEDVIAAGGLEMKPTIEVVEEALRLHAAGDTRLPQKPTIRWSDEIDSEEREGRIMAMPAYVGGRFRVVGLKWIPSVPSNPSRGLPRGIGMIILTDRETGMPLAIMDGTVISAMRTGAVTGLACRLLASPEASVGAVLGAGVQAGTQLMSLREVLKLEEVRVWDVDPRRARDFCERNAGSGPRLTPVEEPREACQEAEVVICVTVSPNAYVEADWIGPGSLFVSISSLDPTVELIARSDVKVCDVWEHEVGHKSRPFARAFAAGAVSRQEVIELGELAAGTRLGRTGPDQRVFVSPIGLAIEDVAAGYRVYRRALDLGIGTRLKLWESPVWV